MWIRDGIYRKALEDADIDLRACGIGGSIAPVAGRLCSGLCDWDGARLLCFVLFGSARLRGLGGCEDAKMYLVGITTSL